MQFTIDKKVLFRILSHCQSVAEKGGAMAALSHVQLSLGKESCHFEATDLSLTLEETAEIQCLDASEASGTESGEMRTAIVPVAPFHDIIRKIPDDVVCISAEKEYVHISSENVKFSLQQPTEIDFPREEGGPYPDKLVVPAESLARILARVRSYIAQDDGRYALCGVYLHTPKSGTLRFVATDGHRLAYNDHHLSNADFSLKDGVILPKKTVVELIQMLNGEEDVEIGLSPTRAQFRWKDVKLTSRLVGGEFVPYAKGIPTDNKQRLVVDAQALLRGVDLVTSVVRERVRTVTLTLSKNALELTSQSDDYGRGSQRLQAFYAGEEMALTFNAVFVEDLCKQVDSGEVELLLKNAEGAVLARDVGDEDNIYVIMPMV